MRKSGGGLEWEPIEFVDSDVDRDGGHAGQVAWLDDDELSTGANRDDGRLPSRTTRNRVAASLLVFALFVAGIGASGVAAYNRHVTDRRIADLLDLRSGPDAPSIPGLAQLAFDSAWRARVAEPVSFAVVNRSPKPVTLLSATISEGGLVSSSSLVPVGDRILAPGQTGTLAGTVTADCTQLTTVQTISLTPLGETEGEISVPELSVLARTSGGMTGVSQLDPEADGQTDLQQRICLQQGYNLLADGRIDLAANTNTRTITLRLSARATVAEAMAYSASAAYSDDPTKGVPGLSLSPVPVPGSPADGIVKPGGEISVEYAITVSSCPVGARLRADEVQLEFDMSIDGASLPGLLQTTALAPLIRSVCGSGA